MKEMDGLFQGLSLVILASNERESLENTIISVLDGDGAADIVEFVIFLKSADCPAAQTAERLRQTWSGSVPLRVCVQRDPWLIRALAEIPALVQGSHFLILSADLEMDSASIPEMLQAAKRFPRAIVCASKWLPKSVIQGYGALQQAGAVLINRIAAVLIRSDGRDLFSLFQIYPVFLIEKYALTDPRTFLYELTLKPVRCGEQYIEIPTRFEKRMEGKTNIHIWTMIRTSLLFLLTAVRLALLRCNKIESGEKPSSEETS